MVGAECNADSALLAPPPVDIDRVHRVSRCTFASGYASTATARRPDGHAPYAAVQYN